MIAAGADLKIYVAMRPIDFRCGHDGLAAKVQEVLRLDPFSGAAFVFRSKRADRIKILVWDRTGLVLVHKRLEGCKFVWPTDAIGARRPPDIMQWPWNRRCQLSSRPSFRLARRFLARRFLTCSLKRTIEAHLGEWIHATPR